MSSDSDNEQQFQQKVQEEDKNLFSKVKDPSEYEKNSNCLVCNSEFSKFSSKRNCQFCGYKVCNQCSEKKRENPQKKGEYVRICDFCEQKFLRQRIQREDSEQEQKLDLEIKQYDEMFKKLSVDYEDFLNNVQKNQQEEQKHNFQFKDLLEEKEEYINKLKKHQQNLEQQLTFHQEDLQQVEKSLQETQENIEIEQQKVDELEKKHAENQEKIQEQEQQVQKLKAWIQSTAQNLDHWAFQSKKFESFRQTGKESSVWGNEINTLNQDNQDIFLNKYSGDDNNLDDNEDGEYNSQQIDKLLMDD
ncbi:Zinc finger, FYVE/PHD-type [Pseudocohnilembus persalinus]|uniref:Zinc finger, FYVE/PHD-type n=1 Tax=Pseudocohnilembus persalinus TaxID=266149 RepID=A0A0V0QHY4_PSEPJ|nr:Zinc finger, FYVE/PHD-type [Pseudocohnilembus persalinus]|eukprot:KRX01815.1 Zinc finger, FYVE/PHD-type [Pseudocohnilembus persalinus]